MLVGPSSSEEDLPPVQHKRALKVFTFGCLAAFVGFAGAVLVRWQDMPAQSARSGAATNSQGLFLDEFGGGGRACIDYSGVKLAESGVTRVLWPVCSKKWSEDCSSTGCCADVGMKCYQKNSDWSTCMASCSSKDPQNESWTCNVIESPEPRTSKTCHDRCRADSTCLLAIYNADGSGSCSFSQESQSEVVWASNNFNSTICGPEGSASELKVVVDKVTAQLPFEQPLGPIQSCSWGGEDCSQTKCCNEVLCDEKFTSCFAYSCYKKTEYFSGCRSDAPPPDWVGTWLGGGREHRSIGSAGQQVAVQGTSLYCFSVINWNTPAPKSFWDTEAQLANNIKAHGVSILQCDGSDFYDGVPTPTAAWGSFSNIDAFQQIWKIVHAKGAYKNFDWTVKVDADAVFIPSRLKMHLDKLRTPRGARVYLENTNFQFKFMGALEVLTREALELFLENGHTCIRGEHSGGEDFFMKGCMDAIGVDHQSDSDLLRDKYAAQDGPCTDGWAVAFHFHKKISSWNWCYNEAVCGVGYPPCPEGLQT